MDTKNEQEITEAFERLYQIDKIGDVHGALVFLEQLSLIAQEYKDIGMEQNILIRRGRGLHALERFDEAIVDLQRAIELGGENGEDSRDIFTLNCLHFLGRTYFELSRWELALDARAVSIRMRQIHSFFKLPFFPHSAC